MVKKKEPFKCDTCKNIFASKGNLMRHINGGYCKVDQISSDDDDGYESPKISRIEENIISHLGTLLDQAPGNPSTFECQFCKKTFSRKDNFDRHLSSRCKQLKKDKYIAIIDQLITKVSKLEEENNNIKKDILKIKKKVKL